MLPTTTAGARLPGAEERPRPHRVAPRPAPPARRGQHHGWRPAAVVPALSSVAAALVVLRHLGTKPLWRDEAISLSVAARPATRIVAVLVHHDANAGLYYLLLHGWMLGGGGAVRARLLSALLQVATAGLAAWAATRWRGPWAGAAAGALVACNPFLVYFGQEARPSALAAFLALASTVALLGFGDGTERRVGLAYTALTVLLLYANLFAVLFVGAQAGGLWLASHRAGRPLPRPLVDCWVRIALWSAPLAAVMALGQRNQISWLPRPSAADLGRTYVRMVGNWPGLLVVGALGLVALAACLRPPLVGAERPDAMAAVLTGSAAAPAVVLWTAGQVIPCFIDRYVICSVMGVVGTAVAGAAVVARRSRVLAAAALVLLVVIGGQAALAVERGPFKIDNAPGAVAFVRAGSRPGDAVGYAGGGVRAVMAAYRPSGTGGFPQDIALAPGGAAIAQSDLYARELPPARLGPRLAGVDRLWIVTDARDGAYPPDGPWAGVRALVAGNFVATGSRPFGALVVTLWVRRAPPAPPGGGRF